MSSWWQDRESWWEAIAVELLAYCASNRDDLVAQLRDTPIGGEISAALLVCGVCVELHDGTPHDAIVQRVAASLDLDDASFAQDTVKLITRAWVIRGVPIAEWWDPGLLLNGLCHYVTLVVGVTQPVVTANLLDRLLPNATFTRDLPDDPGSVLAAYTRAVHQPLPSSPAVYLVDVNEPWAVFAREVADSQRFRADLAAFVELTFLGMADTAEQENAALRGAYRRKGAWLLDRLIVHQSWRLVHEALVNQAEPTSTNDKSILPLEDAETGIAVVEAFLAAFDQWERYLLTDFERALIKQVDAQRLRLARWLRHSYLSRIDVHFLIKIGSFDGPHIGQDVPPWVAENVFSDGGRFVHGASGTEMYWMAVVEDELELEQARFSLRNGFGLHLHEDGDELRIFVAVGEQNDDVFLMPYYFDLSNVESALEFAATLLCGASLYVFHLADEQELSLLGAERLIFPPGLLDRFADRIDATLLSREEGSDCPDYLRAYMEIDDQPPLWFTSAEHAKSESMLTFAAAASALDGRVLAARNAVAQAEFARVTAELDGTLADEHERVCVTARQSLRVVLSRSERITPLPELNVLEGVVTQRRAFVHFMSSDWAENVYVAQMVDGTTNISNVENAELDTERLARLSREWLGAIADGRHREAESQLARLLDLIGATLLTPLAMSLLSTGVEHLVLSPDSALATLPLHAAPVLSGTLQDLFEVSYSPNARLLSNLSSPGENLRLDLVVCSDGSACCPGVGVEHLEGIEQEGRLLHRLAPSATYLTGDAATCAVTEEHFQRARVAHLMAHGRLSDDRLASGMWLSGNSPGETLLSAARIEAGPDLSSMSLVVLSACFSGTYAFDWNGIQSWRGLDAAFLSQGVSAVVGTLWPVDDLAALIYGQELHLQLAAGANLLVAHHRALNVLRTGSVTAESIERLYEVRPSWREELDEIALHEPYWWAPFRLSGRCWS